MSGRVSQRNKVARGEAKLYRVQVLERSMECLGRNLATAGALERAYDLGSEHGKWQNATLGFDDSHPWWSNVDGKAAP